MILLLTFGNSVESDYIEQLIVSDYYRPSVRADRAIRNVLRERWESLNSAVPWMI